MPRRRTRRSCSGHSARTCVGAAYLRTSHSPSIGICPAAGPFTAPQQEYAPPPDPPQPLDRNTATVGVLY
eukprot:1494842-Pyramimonas_sp.AAC.1